MFESWQVFESDLLVGRLTRLVRLSKQVFDLQLVSTLLVVLDALGLFKLVLEVAIARLEFVDVLRLGDELGVIRLHLLHESLVLAGHLS